MEHEVSVLMPRHSTTLDDCIEACDRAWRNCIRMRARYGETSQAFITARATYLAFSNDLYLMNFNKQVKADQAQS